MNPTESLQWRIDKAVADAVTQIVDPRFSDDWRVTYGNVQSQVVLEIAVGASVLCGDDLKVDLGGVHPDQAVPMIEDTIRRAVEILEALEADQNGDGAATNGPVENLNPVDTTSGLLVNADDGGAHTATP